MKNIKATTILAITAGALALTACGKKEEPAAQTPAPAAPVAAPAAAPAPAVAPAAAKVQKVEAPQEKPAAAEAKAEEKPAKVTPDVKTVQQIKGPKIEVYEEKSDVKEGPSVPTAPGRFR